MDPHMTKAQQCVFKRARIILRSCPVQDFR